MSLPLTVCIGMIWDSDQPEVDDIMSVVESVGTILRVSDVRPNTASFILCGVYIVIVLSLSLFLSHNNYYSWCAC